MLAEEEIAVVEGGGRDFHQEVVWAWGGDRGGV